MTTDLELVTTTDAENPDIWDLRLVNGDLVLTDRTTGIAQHIRQRLSLFLGEWFRDRSLGVPWFQKILANPANRALVTSILRRAIAGTPGISAAEVTSFGFNGTTRSLSLSYDAVTDDGETITASDFNPLRL